MDAIDQLGRLAKAGNYYLGPRGGKWADAKHTIPWDEETHGKGHHSVTISSQHRGRSRGGTETEWLVRDPSKPGGKEFHTYKTRGGTPASRKKQALEAHGARHEIGVKVKAKGAARAKKPKGVSASPSGSGKVRVATPKHGEGWEEYDAKAQYGNFAVHRQGGRPDGKWMVTHTPSGYSVPGAAPKSSLADKKEFARFMHEHAGDSGAGMTLGGDFPSGAMDRLTAAHKAYMAGPGNEPGPAEKKRRAAAPPPEKPKPKESPEDRAAEDRVLASIRKMGQGIVMRQRADGTKLVTDVNSNKPEIHIEGKTWQEVESKLAGTSSTRSYDAPKPAAKPKVTGRFMGENIEHTGALDHGGSGMYRGTTSYEFKYLTGPDKGKTGLTHRPPWKSKGGDTSPKPASKGPTEHEEHEVPVGAIVTSRGEENVYFTDPTTGRAGFVKPHTDDAATWQPPSGYGRGLKGFGYGEGAKMSRSMDPIDALGALSKSEGEGTRGGKVIGHTAGGHPIYARGPGKGATHRPDTGSEDPRARHKGKEHYGREDAPGLTPQGSKGLLAVDRDRSNGASFHGNPQDHRVAHQQAFGTGREGAHPGDGVKVLSGRGLHHAAKEAARRGEEGHLDHIKAEVEKREKKGRPEGREGQHHDEAHFIAQAYGTGGVHASKMHRVSHKSMRPTLVKAGGYRYTSKKRNSRGGWTYTYDHPTDARVRIETSHHGDDATGHVTSRTIGASSHQNRTGIAWNDHATGAPRAEAHSAMDDPDSKRIHEHALLDHLGHKKTGKSPAGGRIRPIKRERKGRSDAGGMYESIMREQASPHDANKRYADQWAKDNEEQQKSMPADAYGRPMIKGGLHSFRDPHSGPKPLPPAYLFPYLCSFVEEAYEHEAREPEHKFSNARDLSKTMARAVMGELVQTMPYDTNLRRACQKYKCTVDTIEKLLVTKGILKTQSDAMPDDEDSLAAMGASMIGGTVSMAYSEPSPWMQKSDPHVNVGVGRLVNRGPANVAHTLRDDSADPHALVRKGIEAQVYSHGRQLGGYSPPVEVTVAASCPVHARELHKSQNLWNPMGPCTCGPTPNAYG